MQSKVTSMFLFLLSLLCVSLLTESALLTKEPTQQLSHSFISLQHLRDLATLSNDSHKRNTKPEEEFVNKNLLSWHPTFRDQVDIFFRGYMGMKNSTNVLLPQKYNGYRRESVMSSKYSYKLNHPFISRVPQDASRVPEIIRDITNNTAKSGDLYQWLGGLATIFDTDTSRVFLISQKCRGITIKDRTGRILHNPHFHFIRAPSPFQCYLHSMDGKNIPPICGGSGELLLGHADHSQPLRLLATRSAKKTQEFFEDEVSNGNDGVSLVSLTEEQMDEYVRLDDESSSHHRSRLQDIQEEFMHGVEEYDNMSFLTLSIAAILSSAAVAGVSLGPGRERIAVVTIEAFVVYSFLIIVSHAYLVFMRKPTHLVDVIYESRGNFTYNGMVIEAYSDTVVTAVGERIFTPKLLRTTEIFAIVAAVAVTWVLVLNFREVKRMRKSMKTSNLYPRTDFSSERRKNSNVHSCDPCAASRMMYFEQRCRPPFFCDCPRKREISFDAVTATWIYQ